MNEYIIQADQKAVEALKQINSLANTVSQTLFVVDKQKIIGTLTDGDIRRGLLEGLKTTAPVVSFTNKNFKSIDSNNYDLDIIANCRENNIKLLPVLDAAKNIVDIIDLTKVLTKLPLSALLMAGGLGSRLSPLTDKTPKPMLVVGDKPIIEHNIDRLVKFGVSEIYISVKYLKEQIMDYFGDGSSKGISIKYIEEEKPLGTLGSLSMIGPVANEYILVMNSDILTDLDFEFMFRQHIKKQPEMTVLSIPYRIDIPYAVMEIENELVSDFKEKPSLTYYTNGGVYLLNKSLIHEIPKDSFFDATDLMEILLAKRKLKHYSHKGFWLDIGKPKDFEQSQDLIQKLKL